MIEGITEFLSSTPGEGVAVIGIFAGVIIVWVIFSASVKIAREKEKARREIAAYVAEGSITAEDGERLLQPSPWYSRRGAEGWAESAGRCWGKAKHAAREAAGDAKSA